VINPYIGQDSPLFREGMEKRLPGQENRRQRLAD
jgi:hypothetical protein